ncbi:MAG: flagellar hook-length control protein FliK [Pseudomonadota bacterium]
MSSLPILSSQTPSNGKIDAGKPGNNTPSAEDIANGSAPFGELLAKQLSPQGHDIKSALLKKLAIADGDTLPADPNALSLQTATELRPDGIAIPADLLASLMHKDQRMARIGSKDTAAASDPDARTTPITTLRGDAEERDPAARRPPPGLAGEDNPDTTLATGKTSRQVEAREARTTRSGSAADTSFAAALQAEKKANISAATGKIDTTIQNVLPASSSTAAIGMPNALATTPAAQVAATQATISSPLHQPQWADDFSQKVTWIATQRSQSAELHLNPAQLGPLEVSLKLNGDQATLQFTSAHAAVREAIEQSIPRLRDMLADSGISLGNTTVSDQAPREQQKQGQAGAMRGNSEADNSLESDTPTMQTTTLTSRHNGMVDTFV